MFKMRAFALILFISAGLGLSYWSQSYSASVSPKEVQAYYHPDPTGAPREEMKLIARYPHREKAFTQGLEIQGQQVLESTGLYGQSELSQWDLNNGQVFHRVALPAHYFGEGSTQFQDKIYQLTWRSGLGFIYSAQSYKKLGHFRYRGEGWGLTHNQKYLIMSDGSSTLRFLDPHKLKQVKQLQVYSESGPVERLNELEWIPARGSQPARLLANIWESPYIAKINPQTGQVISWIDLRPLWDGDESERLRGAVPNGIAYDAQSQRLFVTGKLWPWLYEIQLQRP